jgi:hypothetical protein
MSKKETNEPIITEGFDADGFNKNGYDKDGYDRNGNDKDGYDRNGKNPENIITLSDEDKDRIKEFIPKRFGHVSTIIE